jgi:hypothetical protein
VGTAHQRIGRAHQSRLPDLRARVDSWCPWARASDSPVGNRRYTKPLPIRSCPACGKRLSESLAWRRAVTSIGLAVFPQDDHRADRALGEVVLERYVPVIQMREGVLGVLAQTFRQAS